MGQKLEWLYTFWLKISGLAFAVLMYTLLRQVFAFEPLSLQGVLIILMCFGFYLAWCGFIEHIREK